MDQREREYLYRRMQREREISERSTCPYVTAIHAELARLYGARLGGPVLVMQEAPKQVITS